MRTWLKTLVIINGASVLLTCLFVAVVRTTVPEQPALPWPELIATATGLSCVWLTRLEDPLCWPIGIVSSALMAWTFFGYDLPGQALLNLVYFTPVQIYGWYIWVRYDGSAARFGVPVSRLSAMGLSNTIALGVLLTAALAGILLYLFGGDAPQRAWDSSIVAASVIAQWLLNRKRVEAWWWWLIPVNVSSVILFWHQGAYLYSLMYVVFGLHAAIAIRDWRKSCQPA